MKHADHGIYDKSITTTSNFYNPTFKDYLIRFKQSYGSQFYSPLANEKLKHRNQVICSRTPPISSQEY